MLHGATPWTGSTPYELIQNIENKPLKINQKFSPNVIQLIKSMLKIEEKDRIGWDDLLRHNVFQGHFTYYVKMNESF